MSRKWGNKQYREKVGKKLERSSKLVLFLLSTLVVLVVHTRTHESKFFLQEMEKKKVTNKNFLGLAQKCNHYVVFLVEKVGRGKSVW